MSFVYSSILDYTIITSVSPVDLEKTPDTRRTTWRPALPLKFFLLDHNVGFVIPFIASSTTFLISMIIWTGVQASWW